MKKRNEVERMSVAEFMSGQYRKQPVRRRELRTLGLITASPMALLDPVALTVAGVVLVAVNLEGFLFRLGLYDIAETIDGTVKVVLPVACVAGFLYLMFTNPFIDWR